MAKRLTTKFVDSVTEPGRYFDSGNGFFLKVNPPGKLKPVGAKTWIQRIVINGRTVDLGLGSLKNVSLKQARQKAEDNRRLIAAGGDPRSERRKVKRAPTFREVAEPWAAKKKAEAKNKKAGDQIFNTLRDYAFPHIGDMRVDAVDTEDVLRCLQPIWEDKKTTATRVRGRIEGVLDAATSAKYREGPNPARWKGHLSNFLTKQTDAEKGHQPAVAQGDLIQWWTDLSKRKGIAAEALRFTMLTLGRSGEVFSLQWDDVDMTTGVAVLYADRMKAKRPHKVVLSDEALAILRRQERMKDNPHVFPGTKPGAPLSNMAMTKVMRTIHAAKVKQDDVGYIDPQSKRPAVVHGLRASFKTWATDAGMDYNLSEVILAHKVGTETQRAYDRADLIERRRQALNGWHSYLCDQGAGQVITLRA